MSASSSARKTPAGSAAATKAPAKMAVAREGEEVGLVGTTEWSHPLRFSQDERSEKLPSRPLGELRGSRGTGNGPLAPAAQACAATTSSIESPVCAAHRLKTAAVMAAAA